MSDFGLELNLLLNRIGDHLRREGVTAAQAEAIWNAGEAARFQMFENTQPAPPDADALVALIRRWMEREQISVEQAHRILNSGVSAAGNLPAALFAVAQKAA